MNAGNESSRRRWWSRSPGRARSSSRPTSSSSAGPANLESKDDAFTKQANEVLGALAAVFPDVQYDVLREMLRTFPEESRIQVIIESLLRNKHKWVRGRWRVPETSQDDTPCNDEHGVPARQKFRSSQYKVAVKSICYQEFRSMSHSTINAVLAEKNYFYSDARRCLADVATKSWRMSLTKLLYRRRVPALEECPVVRWTTSPTGVLEPTLVPTASEELNEEIERLMIKPLRVDRRRDQLQHDRATVENALREEALEGSATYECEVCFSDSSFERTVMCAQNHHSICHDCIRRTMSEALYGQSWTTSIDTEHWTLRCVALGSSSSCESFISRDLLQTALCSSEEGGPLWQKFEMRGAKQEIAQGMADALICPSCMYAEVDSTESSKTTTLLPHPFWLGLLFFIKLVHIALLIFFISLYRLSIRTLPRHHRPEAFRRLRRYEALIPPIPQALDRQTPPSHRLPSTLSHVTASPHGRKFICRNPTCRRISCLICSSRWHDPHICRTSSTQTRQEAFEHFISARITEAIKRVCPHCNTAFVKASGCNKLTCPCGHSMCNLCRADLTPKAGAAGNHNAEETGYAHFCPHFRAVPGERCTQCERCELYGDLEEDVVITKAREEAAREWGEMAVVPSDSAGKGGGVGGDGLGMRNMDEQGGTRGKGKGRLGLSWWVGGGLKDA